MVINPKVMAPFQIERFDVEGWLFGPASSVGESFDQLVFVHLGTPGNIGCLGLARTTRSCSASPVFSLPFEASSIQHIPPLMRPQTAVGTVASGKAIPMTTEKLNLRTLDGGEVDIDLSLLEMIPTRAASVPATRGSTRPH